MGQPRRPRHQRGLCAARRARARLRQPAQAERQHLTKAELDEKHAREAKEKELARDKHIHEVEKKRAKDQARKDQEEANRPKSKYEKKEIMILFELFKECAPHRHAYRAPPPRGPRG